MTGAAIDSHFSERRGALRLGLNGEASLPHEVLSDQRRRKVDALLASMPSRLELKLVQPNEDSPRVSIAGWMKMHRSLLMSFVAAVGVGMAMWFTGFSRGKTGTVPSHTVSDGAHYQWQGFHRAAVYCNDLKCSLAEHFASKHGT